MRSPRRIPPLSCCLALAGCALLLPAVIAPVMAANPAAMAPVLATTATPAAPYVPPDYLRQRPPLPQSLADRPLLSLSLQDAILTALQKNLQLSLARERVAAVVLSRRIALARFEPLLSGSFSQSTSQSPPLTAQEGSAGQVLLSTSYLWNLGLLQRLPTGGQLSLGFNNSRSDSTLGTAVAPLLYRSTLSLSLSQPLLRDFSFDGRIQWAPVMQAEFDSESERETARLRAMMTVRATEDAYWNLVGSWRSYEVVLGVQRLAEQQLALTRRQIAAGVLPDSDLINVEGTLAQRQLAVVRAEAQIEAAADLLRGVLNQPFSDWQRPLLPIDAPSFVHVDISLDQAAERAQSARPELKQARIQQRKILLDLEVARNRLLPQLNVAGDVGTVGQDADYGRALGQVGERTAWQWRIGADLSWAPLGLEARANIRRIESSLRQVGLSREAALLDVRAQLRMALRNIDTAERRLYAAARARDLSDRSLEVEQRRFLNGLSSNFYVAQRQADVAQARQDELEALLQHEKARSELQLAMGDLLESRQLRFDLRRP
ncbi:MAG TPA: TolC family protein [Pseudomonadota bacterium]|nr:TolC family protein [Pseudomonadota bacterium]